MEAPGPPSPRTLRKMICENARQCFPNIVEAYASGRLSHIVEERDHKNRPIFRAVAYTIQSSCIFDIAIAPGPQGTLQASLVYGRLEDLHFALAGEGRQTYYGAIEALLEATEQQMAYRKDRARALDIHLKSNAPPPVPVHAGSAMGMGECASQPPAAVFQPESQPQKEMERKTHSMGDGTKYSPLEI